MNGDPSGHAAPVSTGAPLNPRARCLAFYLPQFHPVPENDEWWGEGFTEWTNTARARPRFPSHYQPHVPADLGFYDLRCPESRIAQAELARAHGVEGFVYWHYWFAGRRLLERPFDEVLHTGCPDFGFCLAWANETWTGIWHGAPDKVLVEQTYPGPDDDRRHFEHLLPAFHDPRYLTVDGRPIFYLFHPEKLPSAPAFVERWRTMAAEAGLPGLYLIAEVSDLLGAGPNYASFGADGFDAGLYMRLPAHLGPARRAAMRAMRKAGLPEIYEYATEPLPGPPPYLHDQGKVLPTVYPGWDNSPRSGRRGLVLHDSTPSRFAVHLEAALAQLDPAGRGDDLLFVKSWNEWAEGNHLEPDLRYGHGHLEALRSALCPQPDRGGDPGADRVADSIIARQRHLYESRWSPAGRPPASVDAARLALLEPWLQSPLLDVGAGDGLVARTFPDLDVVSTDLTANGLRQLAGAAISCTAEQLALGPGRFRTIVLSEVLEHVGDPDAVLAECRRVATADARLVITVPSLPLAWAEHVWRRRKFGVPIRADNVRDWDPEHERRYTEDLLIGQLRGAGWEPLEVDRFFRSASTAAIFLIEPRAARLTGRPLQLAPRLHRADRLLARIDGGSEILAVARPASQP